MMKLFLILRSLTSLEIYNLDMEELVNLAGFGNRSML